MLNSAIPWCSYEEISLSGKLPPYFYGTGNYDASVSTPSICIYFMLNWLGSKVVKLDSSLTVKSNMTSHLLWFGSRPASAICSSKWG